MSKLNSIVAGLAPEIYDEVRSGRYLQDFNETPDGDRPLMDGDLSRSTSCSGLSYVAFKLLDAKGLPVRREFHMHPYSTQWHLIIAHQAKDTTPSDEDIVTDFNPWTFSPEGEKPTPYLHGKRSDVMDTLRQYGSHVVRVECLTTTTIAIPHTEGLIDENSLVRYSARKHMNGLIDAGYDFGFPDWLASNT